MTMDGDGFHSRRDLLRGLVTGTAIPIAGCSTNIGGSSNTISATGGDTSSPSTPANTRSPSPTPADKQPPVIDQYTAIPQEAGTVLTVSITVIDDRKLASATIEYGEQTITKQLEGKEANISERLTDITKTSSSNQRTLRFSVKDAAGNATEAQFYPDTAPPSLTVTPQIPKKAGTLLLDIEGEDNTGLRELQIRINAELVMKISLIGNTAVSREITADLEKSGQASLGVRNHVRVVLTDTMGNSTSKEFEQYVRKYDKMEDTRLNLGGIYISQAGDALTNYLSDEVDTEPAVGIYDSPIPPEITSRHIDQMTGFGFTHVSFDYGDHREWAEAFLKSDLINEVDIMPSYIMPIFERNMDKSWKHDVLPRTLSFLSERFLSRDNAITIDGRPVLDTWNWRVLAAHDDKRKKLLDEFGSFEAFADFVREEARTDRGEPYILFGIGGAGAHLDHQDLAPLRELAKQFYALRTWFHGTRGGWDAVIDRAIADFEGSRSFAEKHDMEFIPIARPGYDERWDTGEYRTTERYLPRDPDRFRQLLQLADQYRTTDRLFICYNDWIEGHTIEPGTFTGTEYGTRYLEIVREFQHPDN